MPRLTQQQSSFSGGEASPRVIGHTDLQRYASALELGQNAIVVAQGGAKRRDGLLYAANAATSTPYNSRLVPFVAGRTAAWFLEFSEALVKVFTPAGVFVTQLALPYIASNINLLDYAQADSTMYLFHPFWPIYKLERFTDGTWAASEMRFTQLPFAEIGYEPTGSISINITTVGVGRTLTAVAPIVFLASDVGRAVVCKGGIAVITASAGATATCEVTRAFQTNVLLDWTMDSSPQTACTPSAATPEGANITLTLGAAGWRNTHSGWVGDVGSMVKINGGLVKINAFTSSTLVNATIIRKLSDITAAPALAWSLERDVWGLQRGYPRTGTVLDQRLIAAGTTRDQRTIWGSVIGSPGDFLLGLNDDDAWAKTIDGDECSPITYVTADSNLLILTESAEYSLRTPEGQALTASAGRAKLESSSGCAQVRPVSVAGQTLFLQRSARKVRSLAYLFDNDRYNDNDITKFAEHITASGVVDIAWQQEPEGILWAVRADGTLLSCTIDKASGMVAWMRHYSVGAIEAITTVPNGVRDVLVAIVRRWVNGARVRYIEVSDGDFEPFLPLAAPADSQFPPYVVNPVYGCTVDAGKVFDNPAGQSTFSVPHLIGCSVDIVADGAVKARQVVPGSGNVTIDRTSKRTLIGLPFTTRITPLTPEVGGNVGTAQGNSMRTGEVTLRLLSTVGCTLENDEGRRQDIPFRALGPSVLDQPPEVKTESVRVENLGWSRGTSKFSIVQDQPLPLHVLAIIRKFTVND